MRLATRIAVFSLLCLVNCAQGGGIVREVYSGLAGWTVYDLTNSAAYKSGTPSSTNWLTELFETPINIGDNYGQRVHGYILPPQSGSYTFWISSDDNSELWLSTNAYPVTNLVKVAYLADWSSPREWTKTNTQQSAPVYLEAGKMYYIRALMKEGSGGDNLAVRWRLPNGNIEEPIPCTRLLPPGGPWVPPQISEQPADVVAIEGDTVTFRVAVSNMYPVAYQWQRGASNIVGATASNYVISAVTLADTNAQFRCILTNVLGSVTSEFATLTVLTDTNGPELSAVYNVGTTSVYVVFSEPVWTNTAKVSSNYRLSAGLAVTSAVAQTDRRTVVLGCSPLTNGAAYTLTVSNITDLAAVSNSILPGTQWTFTAREFVSQEIGYPALTGSVSYVSNGVNLSAAGTGMGGEEDQFRFNWKQQTGDFDIMVRVEGLDLTDPWAQAGLMARATLQDDSDFSAVLAAPSIAGVRFAYRRTNSGNILLNPDFEAGREPGFLWPRYWNDWTSAIAQTNRETNPGGKPAPSAANDGVWMLMMPNDRATSGNNWYGESQWFAVTPDQTYTYSAYVLIQSNLPAGQCTYMNVEWYNSGKSAEVGARIYSPFLSNQCGWTYIAVTGTAPAGAYFGKAVIGYQDTDGRTNSPAEEFNAYWDSANARVGAGGGVESVGSFPVNYPNTWLRLKRVGNFFSGYASRDGSRWSLLGTVSNALPSTVYLGMTAESRDAGAHTTARFRDWSSVSGGTTGSVLSAALEPPGPSSRRTGIVISEIMYHPADRPDGKDLEFIELFNTDPIDQDLTGWSISGDADYDFPDGTVLPAGGFLVIANVPADVQSVYGITGVLGPYSSRLPNDSGTVRLRNRVDAILLEVEYSDELPWWAVADGLGHSLVLARPTYGEADVRAWAASADAGGSPGRAETIPSHAYVNVWINEILAHTDLPDEDFVELYNHGPASVNVGGCTIRSGTNEFVIPGGSTIPARGFLSYSQSALGFVIEKEGGEVALEDPAGARVIDAVRFGATFNGVSIGRYPESCPGLQELAAPTPGTNNAALKVPDIVINEIMYHPFSEDGADEYIELYNKGTGAVDVSNWRFIDGITFTFPTNTIIPSNGCLVVAANATNLFAKYPQLSATNTVGNYSGSLSDGGERVVLARPEDPLFPTQAFVVVDEVVYGDGEDWGRWADGDGSSLELVDPRGDNRLAANWSGSDESAKSSWVFTSITGRLDNGNGSADEAHFTMLGEGECLIDGLAVRQPAAGANRLTNGTFEAGVGGWVIEGNHINSSWKTNEGYSSSRCLHVRASGGGDTAANRLEADLSSSLSTGSDGVLQFAARWLCGHPDVLLRVRGNWLEAVCTLPVPANLGTPGQVNSRYRSNAGPAIESAAHDPVLPAALEAITVSARVQDPDGVSVVRLKYHVDPSGTTSTVTMVDNGTSGDAVGGDGIYSGILPGQSDGTLVAFRIEAVDSRSPAVTNVYPAVTNGYECLVRFGEDTAPGSFGGLHLWFAQSAITAWTNRPPLSNQPVYGTLVNGQRVIYGIGGYYRGSPFIRIGYDSPVGVLCAYHVDIPKSAPFLGASELNLDSLEPGRDNTYLRERMSFWIAEEMGLAVSAQRYVRLYINGSQRGNIFADVLQPSADYLECWYPDDSSGELFKIDDWTEFSNDWYQINYMVDNRNATLEDFTTTGGAKKKARYRYSWEKKSVHGFDDSFDRVYALVDAMNETNATDYLNRVRAQIDVDEWCRVFALRHVICDWDGYGYARGKNGYAYKADGLPWKMLLWDFDFGLGTPDSHPWDISLFNEISDPVISNKFLQCAPFRRSFLQASKEYIVGPMLFSEIEPAIDARYAALCAEGVGAYGPSALKQWIALRRNSVLTQLSEYEAVFAITSNGGSNFSTNRNFALLRGAAPLDVRYIEINGVRYTPEWVTVTNWQVSLSLAAGANSLTVQGVDRNGDAVAGASDTITITFTGGAVSPVGQLVINEIMYNPTNDNAEFVEICNRSTNAAFDLYDFRLQGADLTFTQSVVLAPGGYAIAAELPAAFAAAYSDKIFVAGTFEGSLDNGGELLRLIQLNGTNEDVLVDEVIFDDDLPWPTNADNHGASLQLIDAQEDNNRIGNWAASTNGTLCTPGASNNVYRDLLPFPNLWINELQATNAAGLRDNAGDRDPWLELYNADSAIYTLTNYYLTDTYTNLVKWRLDTNSVVQTGAFHVVWMDAETGESVFMTNHASFRLSMTTGSVALVRSNGSQIVIIDYVNYPAIPPDRSYGDSPDGVWTNRRFFSYPSPRATNNEASLVSVYINEWMADNDAVLADPADGNYEDWFELYNAGTGTVDLSGYTLTDTLGTPALKSRARSTSVASARTSLPLVPEPRIAATSS